MATRLKPFDLHTTDENQSAFVKGITIQNNIIPMHELVKNYKRKGGPKCCAVQVYIVKPLILWVVLIY